eukprot:11212987-Lingulodinium_polyedra.AAC.1
MDIPLFDTPRLREFLDTASPADVLALFSSPFIAKKVGWLNGGAPFSLSAPVLGVQPAAFLSGAQPNDPAAAPPDHWAA